MNLSLESLKELDLGIVSAAFDRELASVVADLADRPGVKRARRVRVDVAITPVPDPQQVAELASVEVEVSSDIPKRCTRAYQALIRRERGAARLVFDVETPEDIRQATFNDLRGATEKGCG